MGLLFEQVATQVLVGGWVGFIVGEFVGLRVGGKVGDLVGDAVVGAHEPKVVVSLLPNEPPLATVTPP